MEASVSSVSNGTACQYADDPCTPDLQHSRYMSGESDNDSAYPTPSDMTPAAPSGPHEAWPSSTKTVREEVRKIHYIDSSSQGPDTTAAALPTVASGSASFTRPVVDAAVHSQPTDAQASAVSTNTPEITETAPITAVSSALSSSTLVNSAAAAAPNRAAEAPIYMALDTAIVAPTTTASTAAASTDALPLRLTNTAPSSTATTPASTPGATPQTYARKRGRPRKHPLPDPNTVSAKGKRKLSPDSVAAAAAKKKATAAAAARSAASNAGSLLSVPDLGRLIPQGSTSDNAQTFIQNNVRLFADLFVALQKQALTDNAASEATQTVLKDVAQAGADRALGASQSNAISTDKSYAFSVTMPPVYDDDQMAIDPSAAPSDSQVDNTVAAGGITSNPVSGPSDAIRDEIKKKMSDVVQGREAIQAEMLQMRVDASFFENAQKTVDERIVVLRDRIAKHSARLQQEREATRKAREASRKAKKDRKAREKGLRDSEKEERRLAQTFAQLEREIAAEEEERRRLEEAESSDEEAEQADASEQRPIAAHQLLGMDDAVPTASPSEATSVSATATPSIATDTAMTPDRAIGFSDEELAKVLGISTSELAGFSQTLDIAPVSGTADAPPTFVEQQVDSHADNFDVAAFLEMASSFGTPADAAPSDAAAVQHK